MVCLPGTRNHILHSIEEWASDNQSQTSIYCIGDAAGTGKSTIANQMAQKWDDDGTLAARFFFSKGNSGTSTASDLCIFIARDLAFTFPSIRASVRSLLEDTEALSACSVRKQWKKLVSEPLSQLNCPLFIVIDALDECSSSSRGDLLHCIRETFGDDTATPLKIRILLTTRLEKDIESALRPDLSVRIVGIRSSPASKQQNLDDVERFIRHRADQINTEERQPTQRLSEDDINQLIIRSDGLFIFAATACT
jgi:NACHT domain